jgi:signal transduction histidine kinase
MHPALDSSLAQAAGNAPAPATVFLVDDDQTVWLSVEAMLAERYQVECFGSAEACLARLAEALPSLFLLDVQLPGMNGYELCRRLKTQPASQAIPVIFISSNDTADDVLAGYDVGAEDYVCKPFEHVGLHRKIDNLLKARRYQQRMRLQNQSLEAGVRERTEALFRSRQMIRELAAHHEKIREDERARIAREIHDEFGQYLTALRMDTAMLDIRYGEGNPEMRAHLAQMKQSIDASIGVVRNLAAALRPSALDMGLVLAAEWLLANFEERTGTAYTLHVSKDELGLDNERATAAFRILQEALTNITRYAQAGEVEVSIDLQADALVMQVADDGVGFDPVEVRRRKTFGLLGIRERALMFGGESRIESRPGAGTRLSIRIPLQEHGDGHD